MLNECVSVCSRVSPPILHVQLLRLLKHLGIDSGLCEQYMCPCRPIMA